MTSTYKWKRANSFPVSVHRDGCLCSLSAIFMTLVFLASPRQSCGQTASPVPSQKITIHGVVVNTATHEPVGHALVFSGDGRLGTFTDDAGRFEFVLPQSADANPREGPAQSQITTSFVVEGFGGGWLNARKPGFVDPNSHALGRWGGNVVASGAPATPGVELTIPLTPEALIVGRVHLPGESGAGRITVGLQRRRVVDGRVRWEEQAAVRTRANGEFRFSDLEAGTYKLLTAELMDRDPVTADPRGPMMGYPPVYFPNASDFQSAGTIELKAGTTVQAELTPVRQAYYPVKIPITNPPEGNYLNVMITVQGHKGPGFALGYNEQEQRIEGSLPNGSYTVEAQNSGDQSAAGSTEIVVKGAAVEGSPMTLLPGSSVQVRAKLDFKNPEESRRRFSGNSSELFSPIQAGTQHFRLRLEPDGDFRAGPNSVSSDNEQVTLQNLLPGRYWLHIDAISGYVAAANIGDIDLLRRPLTVGHGQTLAVEVTLRDDGAEISGTIEGLGGNVAEAGASGIVDAPSAAAYIYCVPLADSTGQFREARVGRDGKFDLQQVPPGAYRVMAFARPQSEMEYHNREAMRAYDTMGQVIRVSAGQKESVRLPLLSGNE